MLIITLHFLYQISQDNRYSIHVGVGGFNTARTNRQLNFYCTLMTPYHIMMLTPPPLYMRHGPAPESIERFVEDQAFLGVV
jgi:hypothetical protein